MRQRSRWVMPTASARRHGLVGAGTPAGGGTELFFPSFSTLGNTHAQLLNGEWDSTTGADPSEVAEIISASGRGFPASETNVFELTLKNPGAPPACLLIKDHVFTRGTGARIALQFYTRVDQTDTPLDHPVKWGSGVGASNTITVVPLGYLPGVSGWTPFIRTYRDAAGADIGYPRYVWSPSTQLSYATVYEVQCLLDFVTATTYRIHLRIFNQSGSTLLLNSDDFLRQDGLAGQTLAAFYAGTGYFAPTPLTFGCDATNPDAIEQFAMGTHGPTGAADNNETWEYSRPRVIQDDAFDPADTRWITAR